MASKSWTESYIINMTSVETEGSCFFNEINDEKKLQMCKEHVIDKKTISHVSERYGNYSLGNLKYSQI